MWLPYPPNSSSRALSELRNALEMASKLLLFELVLCEKIRKEEKRSNNGKAAGVGYRT